MTKRVYTNRLIELCKKENKTHNITKIRLFDELMYFLSEDQIKEFCLKGFRGTIKHLFKDIKQK